MFKNSEEKSEAIKRAVSGYKKQTSIFSQVIGTKYKVTECSYKIAQCVASKAKPFTDGEFVKETFWSSAEINYQIKKQYCLRLQKYWLLRDQSRDA